MKITVLTDNIPTGALCGEWGLSAYIESNGYRILLDSGTTGLFAVNAEKLGIDLSKVDFAVLSHAHYDHGGGFMHFFDLNSCAPLYMSYFAAENCYKLVRIRHKYIGIPRGIIEAYSDRIRFCDGFKQIADNVYLIPHTTEGLDRLGEKNRMYLKNGRKYRLDDFSHEQTLVIEEPNGLYIFNSCSHSGPDVILSEVTERFPNKRIVCYFGGLHLFREDSEYVSKIGDIFRNSGIKKIYTGHCTGDNAFQQLKEMLNDKIIQIRTGMVAEP